jgi:hypothetical protein
LNQGDRSARSSPSKSTDVPMRADVGTVIVRATARRTKGLSLGNLPRWFGSPSGQAAPAAIDGLFKYRLKYELKPRARNPN